MCRDVVRFGRGGRSGYLRIGELARRTGTSPELLRAWERRYGLLEPSRSSGGFRLYSDEDEARILTVKRLIADGLSAAEAARATLGGAAIPDAELGSIADTLAGELRDALDRFDEVGTNEVLDRLLAALSVETVLKDVLLPYLRILGDRWARGEASVAQEHFASALIRGRLLGLARGWGAARGRLSSSRARRGGARPRADHLRDRGVAPRVACDLPGAGHALRYDPGGGGGRRSAARGVGGVRRTDLDANADAVRRLAERVPVAVGGAGVTEEVGATFGARILTGDPVDVGRSLSLPLTLFRAWSMTPVMRSPPSRSPPIGGPHPGIGDTEPGSRHLTSSGQVRVPTIRRPWRVIWRRQASSARIGFEPRSNRIGLPATV